MIFWIANAPKLGITDENAIMQFINQCVSCSIPDDDDILHTLVLQLQQHTHSSYCMKHHQCRFHFPKPPTNQTLITSTNADAYSEEQLQHFENIIKQIQAQLQVEGNENKSLHELCEYLHINEEDYHNALTISNSKHTHTILSRKPHVCNINNYNAAILTPWQANMDIQFVVNAYMLVSCMLLCTC